MIIGEPFLQTGSAYLGFNLNDDYDEFGGKGKARRQEKKQVRQVKRSGRKMNRLSGKMTKTVGKQQLRANNFGLTRKISPVPVASPLPESADAIQEEQPTPAPEQAPEMPPPPQPEENPETAENTGEEGTDSYASYVGEPKSSDDKSEKKISYGPWVGVVCMGAILILAGYALHKSMKPSLTNPHINSSPQNHYGYSRRTH